MGINKIIYKNRNLIDYREQGVPELHRGLQPSEVAYNQEYIGPDGEIHVGEKFTFDLYMEDSIKSYSSLQSGIFYNTFFAGGGVENINLPNITSIGDYVFSNCTLLQSINLPNVISIGNHAFQYCQQLQSIDLPNAISIGYETFSNCTSLQSISLPNVTIIDNYTFAFCVSLQSINLPNIISISYGAFQNCSSLQSINISNVTNIGNHAFAWCSSLQTINLPNVINISSYAFYDCSSLQSINLPKISQINISTVFQNCNNVEELHLPQYDITEANGGSSNLGRQFSKLNILDVSNIYFNNIETYFSLLSKLIIRGSSVAFLFSTAAVAGNFGQYGTLYVPSSMINSYIADTQWKKWYDRENTSIVAIEGSEFELEESESE